MASTDAKLVPTKNAAYRVTFPVLDADGDLVTGATGLDSEVSLDGGTFADCTNEATEIATASGLYYLDLTAAEMNADTVSVIVKTSSSGAKTTVLTFYPQEAGDLACNVTQVAGTSQTAGDLAALITTIDGIVDTIVARVIGTIAAGTHNPQSGDAFARLGAPAGASVSADVAAIAAQTDDIGVAGAGLTALASAANLATVAGYLDTEIAAILADTNELQTDWANGGRLDLLLDGAASAGDPWTTALPGAYGAGTAGKIVGDNLTAPVATAAALATVAGYVDTEVAAVLAAVDTEIAGLTSTLGVAGAGLTAIGDTRMANLDATVSSRLAPAGTLATVTNLTNAPSAGDLTAAMKAAVNAELLDVLVTDTHAEPTTVPAATSSLRDKLNWLFFLGRNKGLQTATEKKMRNDADSADIATATVSDDGTTFTRGKWS